MVDLNGNFLTRSGAYLNFAEYVNFRTDLLFCRLESCEVQFGVLCGVRRADSRTSSLNYLTKAIKDDLQLRLFHEWEPLSLKRLILQFTQYSPSKGKAHVVAAAIRKNETIGEFENSKSIVK